MRNRRLIIFITILVVILAGGAYLSFSTLHHKAAPKVPQGLEKGSATNTIALDGTERLSQVLTLEQFIAVKQALTTYIGIKLGESPNIIADIVPGSTIVNPDNTVNFTIKIEKPSTTMTILLQRPNLSEIIFSVEGDNSSTTAIYPYGVPSP